MNHGSRVSAIYNCQHPTIKPENAQYLGQRYVLDWCWQIEPEDNPIFAGESAWMYHGDLNGGPQGPKGWIPDSDLKDVKVVR